MPAALKSSRDSTQYSETLYVTVTCGVHRISYVRLHKDAL